MEVTQGVQFAHENPLAVVALAQLAAHRRRVVKAAAPAQLDRWTALILTAPDLQTLLDDDGPSASATPGRA